MDIFIPEDTLIRHLKDKKLLASPALPLLIIEQDKPKKKVARGLRIFFLVVGLIASAFAFYQKFKRKLNKK